LERQNPIGLDLLPSLSRSGVECKGGMGDGEIVVNSYFLFIRSNTISRACERQDGFGDGERQQVVIDLW
jgi:hypothetical protein